ncbi:hypothetical protein C2845_PM05G05720 [Panicum miliaceum]|uniref:Neprosin activation peptide domain-containing protein n=1 Tax=Panicum miliaceum TaxID=4540 RepID=A0A3L6T4Y0_PANMI|nr:hypothetical protein C2845_PM05G05720 [Panicum miliaceum]
MTWHRNQTDEELSPVIAAPISTCWRDGLWITGESLAWLRLAQTMAASMDVVHLAEGIVIYLLLLVWPENDTNRATAGRRNLASGTPKALACDRKECLGIFDDSECYVPIVCRQGAEARPFSSRSPWFFRVAGGNKMVNMKQGDSVDMHMNSRHVIKTIQVQDGDVFDCIDIHQQPAFDHPLLKNHVIQMKPHTYPSVVHINYTSNATKSVRQLPTVGCPTGTIPMLRRNIEGDPMKSSHFHTMNNEPNWKLVGIKTSSYAIYGTRVSINVYEPEVQGKNRDLSASWTLLISQGSNNDGVGAGSILPCASFLLRDHDSPGATPECHRYCGPPARALPYTMKRVA